MLRGFNIRRSISRSIWPPDVIRWWKIKSREIAPSYAPSRDSTFLRAKPKSHLFMHQAEITPSYAPSRNRTFFALRRDGTFFFPPDDILFVNISGPKIPYLRLWAESENDTCSSVMVKIVFLYLCLSLYISEYLSVSLCLCLYVLISTFLSLRLSLYVCISTPLSLRLCIQASVSASLSLRLCL